MITEYTNTVPVENAIYSLLSGHTPLTDEVGDEIEPETLTNQSVTEYVLYEVINTTKDASVKKQISRVDRVRVQVDSYAGSKARAALIGQLTRGALENRSGTTAGVKHGRIEFDNYNGTFEVGNQRYKASYDFFIRVHND